MNPLQKVLRSSTKVYKGARFDVFKSNDETSRRREFVAHPGAVVILPLLGDEIVMIRNERFAVGETLFELPAGTLELGEEPLKTAEREIIEETGYRANKIRPLISFFTSPGISNELMYAFLAEDLEHVGQNLDEGEKITVETLPVKKIMPMISAGAIKDGKTIATLLFWLEFSKL